MSDRHEPRHVLLTDEERQPCEIWSRVMGYHRPTSEWNHGKKEEFKTRKLFTEDIINSHYEKSPTSK